MIKLSHVNKSYDGKTIAVKDVSFEVAEGELLVILGSSGSGKSTIAKMINRLIEPTSGMIEVAGENILEKDRIELRRSIGYVFQKIGLFPHMTVGQNIAVLLNLQGWRALDCKSRVHELLEMVHLPAGEYVDRYPDALSGGQQQRVGVARALASNPACLIMDEPFGALDAITRTSIQHELLELKKRLNKTIVFVTHDIFEAFKLADRIAVMHQGNLEQIATKEEIIKHPATPFVAELMAQCQQQFDEFKVHAQ